MTAERGTVPRRWVEWREPTVLTYRQKEELVALLGEDHRYPWTEVVLAEDYDKLATKVRILEARAKDDRSKP